MVDLMIDLKIDLMVDLTVLDISVLLSINNVEFVMADPYRAQLKYSLVRCSYLLCFRSFGRKCRRCI